MFVECREYPLCVKESICVHCDGCKSHCKCEEEKEQRIFEELAESHNFGNGSDDDDDDDEDPDYSDSNENHCAIVNCSKDFTCDSCYYCEKHCYCQVDD